MSAAWPKPDDSPTVHSVPLPVTPMSRSSLIGASVFGLGTMVHADPSQRSMCVWNATPVSKNPTAHASVADVPTTPSRKLFCSFTFGLSTTLHFVPSQCSTDVWFTSFAPNTARWNPTAHTSVAEVADTLVNVFTNGPTFGLETVDHVVPLKCSIRLTWIPRDSRSPTAQMSPAETPEMLRSLPN